MMTLEKINVLGFFLTSVAGITVVAVFAENAGGAIIGIVVCVIATFIISLFFYTIACLAFFIYRVDSLVQIFRALFTIAKYPLHGLNRIIRVLSLIHIFALNHRNHQAAARKAAVWLSTVSTNRSLG